MKKKNNNLAAQWFKIGDDEFNFAKDSFEDLDNFYSQICFQLQQAVEKYLKGFLVYHNKRFPKIHDLPQLLKLCSKIDKNLLQFLDETNILSQYYLIARYPILDYPPASKKDVKEALRCVEKIINFIKEIIK